MSNFIFRSFFRYSPLALLFLMITLASPAQAESQPFVCPKWNVMKSPRYPVAVWICGESQADAQAQSSMMQLIDKHWPEMAKLPPYGMGPPRGDATGNILPARGQVGNDDELDFYILTGQTDLRRYQGTSLPIRDQRSPDDPGAVPLNAPASAVQINDGRQLGGRAFIIVNRAEIQSERFERIIVHEMFHVLQYRWNPNVMFMPSAPGGQPETSMFADGTTTWAETYYLRNKSQQTHVTWFSEAPSAFQHRPELSLIDGGNQIYRAYIWFLFMEQELGGGGRNGQPIFQLWQQSEDMGSFQQWFEAMNRYFPFKTHFRDFAVRNYNSVAVLTSAGEKHYGQLDTKFPVNVLPDYIDSERLLNIAAPALSEPVNLRPLMAHYWQFDVSGDVRQIEVDLAGVTGRRDSLDVDALVQLMPKSGFRARWERRKLSLPSDSLCLDAPKNQGLNRIVLIVSNHEHDPFALGVGGEMMIRSNQDCGQFSGSGGITYNAHIVNRMDGATEETNIHASMNAHLTWITNEKEVPHWDSSDSHFVYSSTHSNSAEDCTTTTTANGHWDEPPLGNPEKDNVVLGWVPYTAYEFKILKMKGFPGAPIMANIPKVEYGGVNMPPMLGLHPVHARRTGCGNIEHDVYADNAPGCTLSGDENRPGLEGKVTQLADGSYMLDFSCSNNWKEGSANYKVNVTGKLPVKMTK